MLLPLKAVAVQTPAPNPPCHLVAHLNETPATAKAEGLTLPRWFDLHQRILHLLTDEAGCTLEVVGSPWSRSLTLLKSGDIDLMLTVSYTDERNQFADFIGVHYMEESVLVLDKQYAGRIRQLTDIVLLPGFVGVLRDAYYGEEFEKIKADVNFQPYLLYTNTLTQKLNMLKRQRVLGSIEDKTQFMEWNRQYPVLAQRYEISLTLHRAPVYIVASREGVPEPLRKHLKQTWAKVYGSPAHLAILAEFGWTLDAEISN
jgi:polar amino acid transport system substrate-binding protein